MDSSLERKRICARVLSKSNARKAVTLPVCAPGKCQTCLQPSPPSSVGGLTHLIVTQALLPQIHGVLA